MVLLLTFFIIILDQLSKYAATRYLMGHPPYVIVKDFFQLNYVENAGAAFGILQEKRVFFVIITVVVILATAIYLIKNYYELNIFTRVSIAMLLGGAIGNLIDRIKYGYVVDFISFKLINRYDFPVFNIADIFIVVGTSLIMILVLFDKYEVR